MSVIQVYLPRDVRVSTAPFENSFMKISSEGRLAGAVLKQDVPKKAIEAMSIQTSVCEEPPCDEDPLTATHVYAPGHFGDRKVKLPAGYYYLYLIADGPTEVELHLGDLGGKTTLRPSAPARATLGALQPTIEETNTKIAYQAKAEHGIGHSGISLVALELEHEQALASHITACLNHVDDEGVTPPPPGTCNEGGFGLWFTDRALDSDRAMIVAMGLVGPGHYWHEINYQTLGVVTEAEAMEFSLDYGMHGRDANNIYSVTFSWE